MAPKGRIIYDTPKQEEFFSIYFEDKDQLTKKKILKIFARRKDGKTNFNSNDLIKINKTHFRDLKDDVITTVGIYCINKELIEKNLLTFPYINKVFNGKTFSKIHDEIPLELLEKRLTSWNVFDYFNNFEFLLGGPLSHLINPSMDRTILTLLPKTKKKREELYAKYGDDLKKDVNLMAKVEKELVDFYLQELKETGSPSANILLSGSAADPYNQYKTIFISKGPVKDTTDTTGRTFKNILSNYESGIDLDDMVANIDTFTTGQYQKSREPAISGYITKQYSGIYSNVSLAEEGSDCGNKITIPILIDESNYKDLRLYHYIVDNGKEILLTPDNIDKYMNKVVNLRNPATCKFKDNYCSKCFGLLPYKLDRPLVGYAFVRVPNARLNSAMKQFHVSNIKFRKVSTSELLQHYKK